MKLILVLICGFGLLNSIAEKSYAQNARMTFALRDVSIKNVLQHIEYNSEFSFMYDNKEINADRKVNINVKDEPIETVLNQLFGNETDYRIIDKHIILFPGKNYRPGNADSYTRGQQAQRTVSGKVEDTRSQPLPGVAVVIKGTSRGTVTNAEGEYTLTNIPEDATLVFSFVGMKKQEVVVGDQLTINVSMEEETIGLEEVIAVGYAVQERISLTNSVAQVDGDEIVKKPVSHIGQSLQGMASGVVVVDNGGRPGDSEINIRIRGLTTLGDDDTKRDPLIIVDGIEQRMSDINPDDIASISVLKDASSTAIYGSRAANGVILITTRRGEKGDVNVSYHGYYGFQRALNRPEHLDLRSYFELENVARINAGSSPKYSEEFINEYVNATDREQYPLPFPWFDKGVMLKDAPQQNHTLSFSGGTDFMQARASLRYQDIEGIVSNFSDKTNEVRINTDFNVSEKLKVSFDINFRSSEDRQPYDGVFFVFNYMLHATKFSYPQYKTGEYGLGPQNNNPLIFAELSGLRKRKNDYLIGKIKADYQIFSDLKYTLEYGARNSLTEVSAFKNKYRNEDPVTGRVRQVPINSLEENRTSFREYTLNHLLNYHKSLGNNNMNLLLGYSTIDNKQKYLMGFRQDFYNNDIQSLDSGSNDNIDNEGYNRGYGLRSYFGRLNYNYAKKYFIEVNGRYDGSSRFSSTKRYAFFPSFSGAWRISQENFWGSLSETINEFKLRASWGITGNQAIDLYEFYPALTNIDYAFAENPAVGYAPTRIVNENLTWEKTEQLDIGIDLGLLSNRMNFTFDYYNKLTKDILLELPIPAAVGLDASFQNAGTVRNKGWEASLDFRGGNTFKYNLGLNISRNKNVVEDLLGTGPYIEGGGANQTFIIKEGMAMNSLWGYLTDGFFQTEEEIANYPTYQANTKPGDIKYLNLNDDDKITPDDRAFLGYSFPIYTYGSTMNFSYKNFELYMQWQGASGHTTQVAGGLGHQATYEAFTHKVYADYWTENNREARWPRPIKSNLRNLQASDLLTIDADYIRLKNTMISYNVPASLLNKLPISRAQVYINATDLITLSKLNEWNLDPEMPPGRANYYPQVGIYTVGLKLNF
ncbi:TonB-dependent receptor [Mariniphaga sediminis]|uniref:TonB-dependent receptor n=1 Tax=Mariniphaga sediminis TaxID=1628158 RepID=UPI003567D090